MKYFSINNAYNTYERTNERNEQRKMAAAAPLSAFERALLDKLNEIIVTVYGDMELRTNEFKKLYAMLLSNDGKELLHRNDNLRNMTREKVSEWMNVPSVECYIQFQSMSRAVLMVVENIAFAVHVKQMEQD